MYMNMNMNMNSFSVAVQYLHRCMYSYPSMELAIVNG